MASKANKTTSDKTLDQVLLDIEKQFGKGSVMKLGEFKAMEVEAIPTGALSLDIITLPHSINFKWHGTRSFG